MSTISQSQLQKKAFQLAGIGYWQIDLDDGKLFWSEEVKRLHEVGQEYEPDFESAIDFYPKGKHREAIQESFANAKEKGEPYDLELKIITATGNEKWVRTVGNPVMEEGRCKIIYGSTQDITKRKLAENKLKENKKKLERLSRVARETQNIVIITDPKERITWVNKAFEKVTGYSHEEAVGQNPGDLLQGPDTQAKTVERIAKNIAEEKPFSERILNYSKDGTPYWIKLDVTPIKNDRGEIEEFFAIEEDITDQVKTYQRLTEQTKRLQEAQQIAVVGDWHYDIQSGDISWSETVYDIFERDKDKEPPSFSDLKEIYGTEYSQNLEVLVENAIQNAEEYEADFEIRSEKGNQKFIKTKGIPVTNNEGVVIALRGVVQDITERKQAKLKLEQKQKQLENITNNLDGVVIRYLLRPDGDDDIVYVSEGIKKVHEISPEEVLRSPKKMWDRIVDEDIEKVVQSIQTSAKQLTPWDHTWRIETPSGEKKWIRGRGNPKKLDDGSIQWDTVMIDITEQKQLEKDLREQITISESILDSLPGLFYMMDEDRNFVRFNTNAYEFFGLSEDMIGNVDPLDLIAPSERPKVHQKIFEVIETGYAEIETIMISGGQEYHFFINGKRLDLGDRTYILGNGIDISDRVETHKKNRVLLQEIHHRVKNNLAIISGLLSMEMEEFKNDDAKLSFQRSINRIHSMAKVHELLYDTEDYSSVNIGQYLNELSTIIQTTFDRTQKVDIDIDVDQIDMNINEAIPLGMLMNELLTNSLKYAFGDEGGNITIRVEKNLEVYHVLYRDNGRGMSSKPILADADTLGFTIIYTLLQQLDAEFNLDVDNKFEISFTFGRKMKGSHSTL